jgi:hypothetical protein
VNSRRVWYQDLSGSGECRTEGFNHFHFKIIQLYWVRCGNHISYQGEWSRDDHVQCLRGTS